MARTTGMSPPLQEAMTVILYMRVTRPTVYQDLKAKLFEISQHMSQLDKGESLLTENDIVEAGRTMIEEHTRRNSERTALLTQTTSYQQWRSFVTAVKNIDTDQQSLPLPVNQVNRDAQSSRKRIRTTSSSNSWSRKKRRQSSTMPHVSSPIASQETVISPQQGSSMPHLTISPRPNLEVNNPTQQDVGTNQGILQRCIGFFLLAMSNLPPNIFNELCLLLRVYQRFRSSSDFVGVRTIASTLRLLQGHERVLQAFIRLMGIQEVQ